MNNNFEQGVLHNTYPETVLTYEEEIAWAILQSQKMEQDSKTRDVMDKNLKRNSILQDVSKMTYEDQLKLTLELSKEEAGVGKCPENSTKLLQDKYTIEPVPQHPADVLSLSFQDQMALALKLSQHNSLEPIKACAGSRHYNEVHSLANLPVSLSTTQVNGSDDYKHSTSTNEIFTSSVAKNVSKAYYESARPELLDDLTTTSVRKNSSSLPEYLLPEHTDRVNTHNHHHNQMLQRSSRPDLVDADESDDEDDADLLEAISLSLEESNNSNRIIEDKSFKRARSLPNNRSPHIASGPIAFSSANPFLSLSLISSYPPSLPQPSQHSLAQQQQQQQQQQYNRHPNVDDADLILAKWMEEQDQLEKDKVLSAALSQRFLWTCPACVSENVDDPTPGVPPLDSCQFCHADRITEWTCPVCFFDNAVADVCCTMCGTTNPAPPPPPPAETALPGISAPATHATKRTECGLPGCLQRAVLYGFCGADHHERATDMNMLAPSNKFVRTVLVGPSGDFTAHLLTTKHNKFRQMKSAFLRGWQHPEGDVAAPRVQRIYWIRVAPTIYDVYYRKSKSVRNVMSRRLFHGTSQSTDCFFGMNPSKSPCADTSCNVCSILRVSFRLDLAGNNTTRLSGFLRYGRGLYFSPVSSKSHSYNEQSAKGMEPQREWRCMFVCNVAVGKTYETMEGTLPDRYCPPADYDSVSGIPGLGLNYPEVVVYSADQVIPSYLIVYSIPR